MSNLESQTSVNGASIKFERKPDVKGLVAIAAKALSKKDGRALTLQLSPELSDIIFISVECREALLGNNNSGVPVLDVVIEKAGPPHPATGIFNLKRGIFDMATGDPIDLILLRDPLENKVLSKIPTVCGDAELEDNIEETLRNASVVQIGR